MAECILIEMGSFKLYELVSNKFELLTTHLEIILSLRVGYLRTGGRKGQSAYNKSSLLFFRFFFSNSPQEFSLLCHHGLLSAPLLLSIDLPQL